MFTQAKSELHCIRIVFYAYSRHLKTQTVKVSGCICCLISPTWHTEVKRSALMKQRVSTIYLSAAINSITS